MLSILASHSHFTHPCVVFYLNISVYYLSRCLFSLLYFFSQPILVHLWESTSKTLHGCIIIFVGPHTSVVISVSSYTYSQHTASILCLSVSLIIPITHIQSHMFTPHCTLLLVIAAVPWAHTVRTGNTRPRIPLPARIDCQSDRHSSMAAALFSGCLIVVHDVG